MHYHPDNRRIVAVSRHGKHWILDRKIREVQGPFETRKLAEQTAADRMKRLSIRERAVA